MKSNRPQKSIFNKKKRKIRKLINGNKLFSGKISWDNFPQMEKI